MDSDSFWKEGWVYTRVQNRVAFVHDGRFLLFILTNSVLAVFFCRILVGDNSITNQEVSYFCLFYFVGEVVLDTQLTVTNDKNCKISSIRPIAVSVSENAKFLVKGFNMSRSTRYSFCIRITHHITWALIKTLFGLVYRYVQSFYTLRFRLLCALEGMYLVQQSCSELMDGYGSLSECEKGQSLSFPCSIPNVMGRGFIEVTSCPLRYLKMGFRCCSLH